jgi:hypothetical protein
MKMVFRIATGSALLVLLLLTSCSTGTVVSSEVAAGNHSKIETTAMTKKQESIFEGMPEPEKIYNSNENGCFFDFALSTSLFIRDIPEGVGLRNARGFDVDLSDMLNLWEYSFYHNESSYHQDVILYGAYYDWLLTNENYSELLSRLKEDSNKDFFKAVCGDAIMEKYLQVILDAYKKNNNYSSAIDLIKLFDESYGINRLSELDSLYLDQVEFLIDGGSYSEAYEILVSRPNSSRKSSLFNRIVKESPRSINWKIGEEGPAGGYIIYDADADNSSGNADGLDSRNTGWRYIESTGSQITTTVWGGRMKYIEETESEVGTGKRNTEIIISTLDNADNAASICTEYAKNGYADWYLPSLKETVEILKVLTSNGTEKNVTIWSSTAHPMLGSWVSFYKNSGIKEKPSTRSNENAVFAVRYF